MGVTIALVPDSDAPDSARAPARLFDRPNGAESRPGE